MSETDSVPSLLLSLICFFVEASSPPKATQTNGPQTSQTCLGNPSPRHTDLLLSKNPLIALGSVGGGGPQHGLKCSLKSSGRGGLELFLGE